MKIFFTASFKGKETYQKNYDEIIRILGQLGCEVISLENTKYEDFLSKSEMKDLSGDEIREKFIRKALKTTNAAVFETSIESISIGIEIGLALAYNKTALCLSANRDLSKKTKRSGYYAKHYKDFDDLKQILIDHIDMLKDRTFRSRLNIVVNSEQKNYLNSLAKNKNKNISEILRDLIEKEKQIVPVNE